MTRDADLQAVRREGKRIRTGLLEVRVLASPLPHPRVGIVVPRFKHTAVARNRLKRRLRELARLRLLPVLDGAPPADVLLRAAPPAYGATFDALRAELERALGQLARLTPPPRRDPAARAARPPAGGPARAPATDPIGPTDPTDAPPAPPVAGPDTAGPAPT